MLFVSFNANSIRIRLHQVRAIIDRYQPDVIGVQETKVADEAFPVDEIAELGYHSCFYGQKTHYGVALLSKVPAANVRRGFPDETPEAQRRLIAADFDIDGHSVHVVNGYFPQGESREHPSKFPAKRDYYTRLRQYLAEDSIAARPLLVMGDFNVAPDDLDIGIGPANAARWLKTGKCSFLPEEREWFRALTERGLRDSYRELNPDSADYFSWFDYRSRGFENDPKRGLRIDMILAGNPLAERLVDAGIDYEIRAMDKPSDHCPIWARYE